MWIIRNRQRQWDEKRLTKSRSRVDVSRISLGAALGSVVGFFYEPWIMGERVASVSLAGLGFLAGYSTEIVFQWFDRFRKSEHN